MGLKGLGNIVYVRAVIFEMKHEDIIWNLGKMQVSFYIKNLTKYLKYMPR